MEATLKQVANKIPPGVLILILFILSSLPGAITIRITSGIRIPLQNLASECLFDSLKRLASHYFVDVEKGLDGSPHLGHAEDITCIQL